MTGCAGPVLCRKSIVTKYTTHWSVLRRGPYCEANTIENVSTFQHFPSREKTQKKLGTCRLEIQKEACVFTWGPG